MGLRGCEADGTGHMLGEAHLPRLLDVIGVDHFPEECESFLPLLLVEALGKDLRNVRQLHGRRTDLVSRDRHHSR